jgi:polyhydroxyalkanoate synthesis regulator protein
VRDVKTNEDLTRSILLQIIAEQEHGSEPIFSTKTLTQIIRFYGDSIQSVAADYLQKSLELFVQQQKQFQESLKDAVSANPFTAMTELTENNLKLWRQIQDSFFQAAGFRSGKSTAKKED